MADEKKPENKADKPEAKKSEKTSEKASEVKKETPKKDTPKKEAPKKDTPKKDTPKKEAAAEKKSDAKAKADKKPEKKDTQKDVKKDAKKSDSAAAKAEKTKKQKKAKAEPVAEKTGLHLANIGPARGARRPKLRVGRGRATGAGKTCNRGHNGEGQRAGRSRKRGFEGGQMPGYRRVPKVDGFRLVNPRKWLELNVCDLDRVMLKNEAELTYEMLRERGFLRQGMDGVRILGKGECGRKVTIHAHHVTAGARQKIEGAGGAVVIVTPPKKGEAPKAEAKTAKPAAETKAKTEPKAETN